MKKNHIFSSQSAIPVLCAALLIFLVAGCAAIGTVIVDVDVDAQISGRDAAGRTWLAPTAEFIKQKRHFPQSGPPFFNVQYQGKVIDWIFTVWPTNFGGFVRSNATGPVCFRFDQARMTSNLQQEEVPLQVYYAQQGGYNARTLLLQNKPGEHRFFDAPKLCFAQEKGSPFTLSPDMSALFPSGKMFNINQSGKELNYSQRGTGNWLKIFVPIEYEGKREDLEIKFTAIDSKARMSYH